MAKELTAKEIVRREADKHRRKADENQDLYQETGEGRYDTAYYKHDSIATALEKYLDTAQIREDAIAFKNALADFAAKAAAAKGLPDNDRLKALDELAEDLMWRVRMEGI